MVKMPYSSRDPLGFRRIAKRLTVEPIECGYYSLDCSRWEEVRIEFVQERVYDKLSGLTLRLRKPVIVFVGRDEETCRVESRWNGEAFTLDCEALKRCCVTRGP